MSYLTQEEYQRRTYTYDRYGRMLEKQDGREHSGRYGYENDTMFHYTWYETEEGERFTYQCDFAGKITLITSSYETAIRHYSNSGAVIHLIDGLGNVTEESSIRQDRS